MVTAIAVLAVVGGALAFKAKSYGVTIYTSTTNIPATGCTIQTNNTKLDPLSTTKTYATNVSGGDCSLRGTAGAAY